MPNAKLTIALCGAAAVLLAAPPAAAQATPEAIVEAMRAAANTKPGMRPSNAKGTCIKGRFTPTADAAALSKAPIFAKPTPITARLAMGGGNPGVADTTKGVARGFSIRFEYEGGETFLVMISAPVFGSSTPEQMLAAIKVNTPGPDGQRDPAKVKAFTDANPNTTRQSAWLNGHPVPASWAGVNYWAVQAYTLTNAKNEKAIIKFKAVPTAGELSLTDDEAKAKPANFLADDLKERLAKGPATFDLMAILGQLGDPTNDSTTMWPEESRRSVKLGTIAVAEIVPNATCDAFTFDPVVVPDGMAGPADDPLFEIRSPTYAISISARQ